jgi:hypothetical protein
MESDPFYYEAALAVLSQSIPVTIKHRARFTIANHALRATKGGTIREALPCQNARSKINRQAKNRQIKEKTHNRMN